MRTDRRGQALVELAAGMFALALVVSALCLFAVYIVNSLRVQNSLRSSAPQPNKPVKVEDFAVRHVLNACTLPVSFCALAEVGCRYSALETLRFLDAVAGNRNYQPFRQRINDRHTYPVKSS